MSYGEHGHALPNEPRIPSQVQEEISWAHTRDRQKERLTFWQAGVRFIPRVTIQPTTPETNIIISRRYLMNALLDTAEGVDTKRAETFFIRQGLRITPYRFVEETDADIDIVTKHFDEINDLAGAYKPSLDIALVRRHAKIEAVNGPMYIESVLVHELAHGTNNHHHLVYRRLPTQRTFDTQHGRGGHRVYDCHNNSRGRFLEEAYAERMRGLYVTDVLKRPRGFAGSDIEGTYVTEKGSRVDLRYTVRRINGQPGIVRESFAGQTLDHLCQIDPQLDADLRLARTSAEGLRNVAKRIDAIKPGLYVYLRDTPLTRADFRQRLIYVQRWLWHIRRHPAFNHS